MKSRMDKYYNNEKVMQRTAKNDFLYDELYKEKQRLNSNVTILDNVNEVDISKIKEMIDNRENYKKVRDYNNLISEKKTYKEDIDYKFDEIDNNDYDINMILQKKRSNRIDDERVRNITDEEYKRLKDLAINTQNVELLQKEEKLNNLLNTINNAEGDLFSNLKEDEPKEVEKTKEDTFYTNTSKIMNDDFEDFNDKKEGPNIFIVIAIASIIVALGVIFYLKILS